MDKLRVAGLAAVVVAAFVLRLEMLPIAIDREAVGDPRSYVQIAHNIVAGNGMVNDPISFWGGSRAHYPPLYPFMLAGISLVAPLTAPTFFAINFLADLATAASLLWLARLIGVPARAGLAAAGIYLLWPTSIIMSPIAQKEPIAALLTILLVISLLRSSAVALGIVAALLALTQPVLATLPIIMSVALRSRFPSNLDWLRTITIGALIAAAVMSPWWIRNYLVTGEFVPLTDSSGWALWIGTMPYGSGNYWFPLPERLLDLRDGLAISREASREALAWIAANPAEFIQHNVAKALHMLGPDRWNAKPLAWMRPTIEPPIIFLILPMLASIVMVASAAIGGILARQTVLAKIVLVCLIQLFVVQLWFEFPERHRYFAIPLLVMIAVEGVRRLADLHHRKAIGGAREIAAASLGWLHRRVLAGRKVKDTRNLG